MPLVLATVHPRAAGPLLTEAARAAAANGLGYALSGVPPRLTRHTASLGPEVALHATAALAVGALGAGGSGTGGRGAGR